MALELRIYPHRPEKIVKGSVEDLFINSYLGMRFAIGTVAFTLPFLLIFVDGLFIDDRVIRGSMSAYYHSGAREVFVGGLFVVGGFLLTYMSARHNTYDFVLSLFAGIAVIVVAIFPTARYQVLVNGKATTVTASSDSCERFAGSPICSPIQEALGESSTRVIHTIGAGSFVLLLAALCAVFALREFGYGNAAEFLCGEQCNPKLLRKELRARNLLWRHLTMGTGLAHGALIPAPQVLDDMKRQDPPGPPHHARATLYFLALGFLILVGAVVAVTVSTYWGEVVAFVSFGIAWLYAGKNLRSVQEAKDRLLRDEPPPAPGPTAAAPPVTPPPSNHE